MLPSAAKGVFQLIHLFQHTLCIANKDLSVLGQHHSFRAPFKERRPQAGFQFLDRAAKRRLSHIQPLGRFID